MREALQAALDHAGAFQRAVTLGELVEAAWRAVRARTRYSNAWIVIFEGEAATHGRLVLVSGGRKDFMLAHCPLIPLAGDQMVEEIVRGRAPVVVVDARTDPRTNKEIVGKLGNRSIVNVPLVLGRDLLGAFGVGTFGDEPLVDPDEGELDFLTVLGVQLASAFTRIQLLDRQRAEADARDRLERHLESLQRVELMGVLASGVAHDLANYLSVIQSNVALVGEEGGMDEGMVGDVRLAIGKARAVTQRLLALGRSHAARRERIDLNARVESTLHLVRAALPRGVQVTHRAQPAPAVEADPVQIDQVLANLLLNARDAVGPSGSIRVGVDEQVIGPDFAAAHPWARPGRYGHVSVADDGCGIAPEHLERIFDPLFSTKTRGTGLGLAVVSRVVEQHQGLVHCESRPGAGTTFDVYLPAGLGP